MGVVLLLLLLTVCVMVCRKKKTTTRSVRKDKATKVGHELEASTSATSCSRKERKTKRPTEMQTSKERKIKRLTEIRKQTRKERKIGRKKQGRKEVNNLSSFVLAEQEHLELVKIFFRSVRDSKRLHHHDACLCLIFLTPLDIYRWLPERLRSVMRNHPISGFIMSKWN